MTFCASCWACPAPPPPPPAVARQLRKRGFAKVYVIQGGCANWAAAKLTMRPWKNPAALLPPAAEPAKKETRVEEPEVTVVA
jgi:3-mercaptopyruvate sulfurtransferase SseA